MSLPLSLADYAMNQDRGFLCDFDADQVPCPDSMIDVDEVAAMLPEYITSGRIRHFLDDLRVPVMEEEFRDASEAMLRTAFVRYSFLVQAYVWGEPTAPTTIPRSLAVPICWLAEKTGQHPLLTYASYVLDNWGKLDPEAGIELDNIFMIQNFLSGMDEAWFVLIHVAIEAKAAGALALIPDTIVAANEKNDAALISNLERIATIWSDVNAIFDRMPERCDPYIYFNRVRPYIHGWKDNPALPEDGLIYEGVSETPMTFRGQTGSQSSIVPSMDAFLQLHHEGDPLRRYLDELHAYRLPHHRRFIEDIRTHSKLRDTVVALENPELKDAYNHVVERVAAFRGRHLEYAASYINKQSKGGAGNDTDVGTGGTPFMRYLKKHRDESTAQLLK